jgi:hypothetical protein
MVQKFICAAVIAASYLVICTCICAQAPNGTLTFGDVPDGTTATTANTGFGGVRVGTGGGGFTLQNPGESIGSGAELKGVAPTTGSVNSVGVTSAEFGTAAQVYTVQFDAYFSGGSSGTWYFFAGNGTSFGSAQSGGFTGTDVFTGVRFAFGFGGALTIASRGGTAWSNLAIQPMTQFNAYKITIVGNNSTSTVNYGVGQSLAPNRSDIWVGTTLVADEAAKAQLASATSINAFRFYGENSAGNVATIALDNISWWNTAVQPAAPSPGTLQFSSATYSGSESGGSIALTVTRTGGSSGSVGAQITQTDGTATGGGSLCSAAGEDYTKATYAVNFGDGETSKIINIPVCSDARDETDETFTATLGSVSGGATLGSQSSSTVTILDDDTAGVTVTQSGGSTDVTEGGATDTYTVVLNSQPTSNVVISVSPDSQTNVSPSQLTFTPSDWNTPQTVTVTAIDDSISEGSHSGTIQHSASSTDADFNGISVVSVTANITDNDTPTISLAATSVDGIEGQTAKITVHRSGDTSGASTVEYEIVTATATSGTCGPTSDADLVSGTGPGLVIFLAGESDKDINIPICADLISENPAETFSVTLANPIGGVLGTDTTATVRIIDAATEYVNSTQIDLRAGTTSSSSIVVSDTVGKTAGLRVTLFGVSVDTADNLDALLVGPNGAKYVLVGDTGGAGALSGVTLTLEGAASQSLPDSAAIAQGQNYRPTNCEPNVSDFVGAPAGPYLEPGCDSSGTTLAQAFSNFVPNGTWTLYVRDDNGVDPLDRPAGSIPTGSVEGWGIQFLSPTAANTSVSGRVRTADGRGIQNAVVTIEGGGLASPVTVVTSSFGMYRFENIPAGQTYIVTVRAKRFGFERPSRVVSVTDDLAGVDFVAR